MQCEMCGADFPRLRRARVEGTIMNVCNNCVRFGEELAPPRPPAGSSGGAGAPPVAERLAERQRRMAPRDVLSTMEEELVDGFGERIRRAREAKGWTREQLADRIHQPVPTVAKFESEALHPADQTVQTLERELGIKLLEPVPRSSIPKTSATPSRGLTLGDLIKQAKKKDE